jgi:hypothetical protein
MYYTHHSYNTNDVHYETPKFVIFSDPLLLNLLIILTFCRPVA